MPTWIYTSDGRVLEKGSLEHLDYLAEGPNAPMIARDEGNFISPIDGKVYSGRAGMREHCVRHDVVNWRDLKGLPAEMPKSKPDSREIKAAVIEAAKQKGLL